MLENQEPQENQAPELTVEQKLEAVTLNPVTNLLELSATPVKPLLDVLGQDTTFYGYVDGKWLSSGSDEVTVRMELTHLAKKIAEAEATNQRKYEEIATLTRKISKLETYLDDNWDDIDEEVRDELCEIFEIEGEVTKTIKITVTGTVEITAPRGYDWDNIENDIDLNCETIINNSELTEAGYGFSHDDTTVEEY